MKLGLIWTILGIILGAASLASLVQRLLDVGLAPVTADILEYYRWFMADVVRRWVFDWWTIRWFDWQMPERLLDTLALFTTLTAIYIRDSMLHGGKIVISFLIFSLIIPPMILIIVFIDFGLGSIIHALLLIPVMILIISFFVSRFREHHASLLGGLRAILTVFSVPVVAAAFFAWNAVLLTPPSG
jgi:hypothetical protein